MLPISERSFELNGKRHTHYYVDSAPVACIIAQDEDGKYLLIRQYRAPLDRPILEFPAGKVDPGEDPRTGALRELEEETGYRAAHIEPIFRFYTTPGYSTEEIHVFYATDLQVTQTNFDDGESIETMHWTSEEIERAIEQGDIIDGKTILSYWALQRRKK